MVYDPTYNLTVNLQTAFPEVQWWNRSDPIWLTARNQVNENILAVVFSFTT